MAEWFIVIGGWPVDRRGEDHIKQTARFGLESIHSPAFFGSARWDMHWEHGGDGVQSTVYILRTYRSTFSVASFFCSSLRCIGTEDIGRMVHVHSVQVTLLLHSLLLQYKFMRRSRTTWRKKFFIIISILWVHPLYTPYSIQVYPWTW